MIAMSFAAGGDLARARAKADKGSPHSPRSAENLSRLPLAIALYTGEISVGIVAELIGQPPCEAERAIAEWLQSGAIGAAKPRGKSLRVRPAVRTRALAEATPRQRRRAYEHLARTLDGVSTAPAALLAVARYFREAAFTHTAAVRYLQLAERHLERNAYAAAIDVLAEAAAAVPGGGPQQLAVLELQARSAVALGAYHTALAALHKLRRAAAACGDAPAQLRAAVATADVALQMGAYETAGQTAVRALPAETDGADDRCAALAALIVAESQLERGRAAEAERGLRRAVALHAGRFPDIAARLERLRGTLQIAHDPGAAAAILAAAAAAANAALDAVEALKAARALAAAQRQNADLFSTAATLREALASAERYRLPAAALPLAADLLDAYFEAGRYRESYALVTPPLAAAAPGVALRIAVHAGDARLIEACADFNAVENAFASASPQRIAAVIPSFAALARRRGDDAAAHALHRRAMRVLGAAAGVVEYWCDAAEHCAPGDLGIVASALAQAARHPTPLGALLIVVGRLAIDARTGVDAAAVAGCARDAADALLTAGFRTWADRARALGDAPAAAEAGPPS